MYRHRVWRMLRHRVRSSANHRSPETRTTMIRRRRTRQQSHDQISIFDVLQEEPEPGSYAPWIELGEGYSSCHQPQSKLTM